MPIDVPVIMLIAIAAVVVAAVAAQRAVEHAELTSGRPSDPDGRRPGPLGPFLDALDESVAAATVRSWFGASTLTRRERAEAERVAAIARADEARRRRPGVPEAHGPKRLVVAGAGAPVAVVTPARSTLSVELLAATLGLAVVVLVVVGIWPRESSGAVLSVTATPAPTHDASASPSPAPPTAP